MAALVVQKKVLGLHCHTLYSMEDGSSRWLYWVATKKRRFAVAGLTETATSKTFLVAINV